MTKFNFQKYSFEELLEAYESIDKSTFPDRADDIYAEIEQRKKESPLEIEEYEISATKTANIRVVLAYAFASIVSFIFAFVAYENGEIKTRYSDEIIFSWSKNPTEFGIIIIGAFLVGLYLIAKAVLSAREFSNNGT